MGKINKGVMSSNTNEWYTPIDLFKKLDDEFNFNLDPCCTKESAKCKNFYTIEDSGLIQDWKGKTVFVNPPYGRAIKFWIEKCYKESLKKDTIIVALIPARTDTSYWHDFIFNKAIDIRFLRGRIKFGKPDNTKSDSAPFPSAVIVWKKEIK